MPCSPPFSLSLVSASSNLHRRRLKRTAFSPLFLQNPRKGKGILSTTMMESGFETSFPVVFFDGDSTMDMGNVFIDPSLDFKAFRSIISQKIGVSPHQITIYFERGAVPVRPPFTKVGGGRRIPVTNKFNFASILRESSCFFFVVSKRSRRVRRRKNKQSTSQSIGGLNYPFVAEISSPGRFDLVARSANLHFGGANFPYAEQFSSPPMAENWYGGGDYLDYASQLRRALEVEKERYLMSLNLNSNVYSDLDHTSKMNNGSYEVSGSEITSEDGTSSFGERAAALVCDMCTSAKMEGQTAPFHWCKFDAVVTTVFRSPAGPIARPARTRVDPSGF